MKEYGLFISSAFKGKNSFWRYLIMSVSPFLVSNIIGSIPLLIVVFLHASNGIAVDGSGMPDFSRMGLDLNLMLALMIIPFIFALLTFILLMKPVHGRTVRTVINGGIPVRWGRILISAAVWLIISAGYLLYMIRTDPSNFVINNTSKSLIVLAIVSVLLIPFQAAFEEILFRGYLMQGFAVLTRNRWMPIVLTSLLFGLMHSFNPEVKEYGFIDMMPQYVLFGLVFATAAMLDGGIEVAIGAHAANNVFLSVFVTTKSSALQTPALYLQNITYPWKEFGGMAITSVLFIIIMAIIFKWKDFGLLYKEIREPERMQIIGSETINS